MELKKWIKQLLLGSGAWYPLNLVRETPSILHWVSSGCGGIAPHAVKMMIVQSYLRKFSISNFVETGTYLGDTLGYVARSGVRCTSIELSPVLYESARRRFRRQRNVTLLEGDSGDRIPGVLAGIEEPTLFWLDGHYSAGITASAQTSTPISSELKAILAHPVKEHVILIDDAHSFDGTNDYPHLEDLLRVVRADGTYKPEVSVDIIRLVPSAAPC